MQAHSSTTLPVIEIQRPCNASWESMRGDDRRRFCDHCQRYVHNLSAMREDEVAEFVCQSAGRLCVRFEMADDGKPKTLQYASPTGREGRARRWFVVGMMMSLLTGATHAVWRWTHPTPVAPPARMMVMGDMMPPRQPTPTPPPSTP